MKVPFEHLPTRMLLALTQVFKNELSWVMGPSSDKLLEVICSSLLLKTLVDDVVQTAGQLLHSNRIIVNSYNQLKVRALLPCSSAFLLIIALT